MNPFDAAAAVIISDGGLATELEARGHDLSDGLWSARLLTDAPDEITAAHLAFFRAGAVIATKILAGAGPDLLALETIPDVDEAEALLTAISGLGRPAWLSYTIDGERTRAGQPLADAFALAADVPEIVAVGVNCCDLADVPAAIAVARGVTGKPVIVYPNSGEQWDAARRGWTGTPDFAAAQAARWAAEGARIIGGCCRVRPDGIAQVARALA